MEVDVLESCRLFGARRRLRGFAAGSQFERWLGKSSSWFIPSVTLTTCKQAGTASLNICWPSTWVFWHSCSLRLHKMTNMMYDLIDWRSKGILPVGINQERRHHCSSSFSSYSSSYSSSSAYLLLLFSCCPNSACKPAAEVAAIWKIHSFKIQKPLIWDIPWSRLTRVKSFSNWRLSSWGDRGSIGGALG